MMLKYRNLSKSLNETTSVIFPVWFTNDFLSTFLQQIQEVLQSSFTELPSSSFYRQAFSKVLLGALGGIPPGVSPKAFQSVPSGTY